MLKLPGIFLKNDNHIKRVCNIFKNLSTDSIFTDVTLVATDGSCFEAHKAVLGYCSPYFNSLLVENLEETRINVSIGESYLKAVLDYIYEGVTKVKVNEVEEFFAIAKQLQLKGIGVTNNEISNKLQDKKVADDNSDKGSSSKVVDIENQIRFKQEECHYDQRATSKFQVKTSKEENVHTKRPKCLSLKEDTEKTTIHLKPKLKHKLEFSCKKCDFKSPDKKILRQHKKVNHDYNKEKALCDECDFYGLLSNLKTHKLIHIGEKVKCDLCSYATYKPSHLKEHKMYMHTENYHYCDQCSFKTKRPGGLKRHIERDHEGKIYSCEICPFTTKWAERFKEHKQGVHEGIRYPCDECEKSFIFKRALRLHIETDHKNIRYPCSMCNFQATRKHNLGAHEKAVHKGLKGSRNSFATSFDEKRSESLPDDPPNEKEW